MSRASRSQLKSPRARRIVIENARNGDIGSIKRLESIATKTLLEWDFKTVVQIFLHHAFRDLAHTGTPERTSHVISASALAALHSAHNLVSQRAFKYTKFGEWFGSTINESDYSWTRFWNWTKITLSRCLLSPTENAQLIASIDGLVARVRYCSDSIRKKLSVRRDILRVLTAVWLTEEERVHATLSIPALIPAVFSSGELVRSVGGSRFDLAAFILQRFHYLKERYCDILTRPRFEKGLASFSEFIESVAEQQIKGTTLLVVTAMFMQNASSLFIDIVHNITSSIKSEINSPPSSRLTISPYALITIRILVKAVCRSFPYAPSFVAEAVASGFLSMLVNLQFLREVRAPSLIAQLECLASLDQPVATALDTLRHHLFHRRVFRMLDTSKWLLRIRPGLLLRNTLHKSHFEKLVRSVELAGVVRSTYKQEGDLDLCDGQNCPKKGTKMRVQLKECTGCRYFVYCSSTCQRSSWTIHRPVCLQIRASSGQTLTEGLLRKYNPGMKPDVVRYYQTAIRCMAETLGPELRNLYDEHRLSLRPSTSAEGSPIRPTHVIKIDIDTQPMVLSIEEIQVLEHSDPLDMCVLQLEECTEDIKSNSRHDTVLTCAAFSHGQG